ncbi:aminotransferase class IV [Candidatus Marinarcus aquaticus]|uniref:Branched-chain amino acid aminotransferase n=1 Tax=Candidatus Marinarcus aquaticus TaxID=2044504 RepID=A0A4Q0XPA4_9BACT|nr:aminotransferase class IV [Candidatus Marinarcus aquaticus]RXJ56440.1 branched-chain amino acid aminotransferase [Candidatus Marinarcus aquaticus]
MNEEETYFETIKCDDGIAFNLEYHNRRIARTISLNINLQEYILPINDNFLKCKVLYDEYGVVDVEYSEYEKRTIQSFKIIEDNSIEYAKKSLDRSVLELAFNQRQTADEIIIVKDGLLTDTSISNIALYDGSHWLTPKKPLLLGTTRERLLEHKELIEANLTIADLKSAKKIALLNAMIGMDVLENYSLLM